MDMDYRENKTADELCGNAILVTQYYVTCFWGSDWGSDRGCVPAQTVLGLAQLFA